ncbi:MAG: YggS family pyridoxal phosphate enzyme [Gaiellaceae bacterium]
MRSPDEIRERYAEICTQVGVGVTVVAATKYVSLEEMGALVEAGIEVVGENRVQDLAAKHDRYGSHFRWHFIGHLQSRKAPLVSELCELCHSLASESAIARLKIPALVEVNLAAEDTKSGIAPEELEGFLGLCAAAGVEVRGLTTMPPLAEDRERSRPYFRRLRELAERFGLAELSMGTSQDFEVAAEEGATYVRVGGVLWR